MSKKEKKKLGFVLFGSVCVYVRRSSFFFVFCFAVLIPHSDHSSRACTRKVNNASDMSLVEQRLGAPPSSPFLHSTRSSVQCVVVLSTDYRQSDGLSGTELMDPLFSFPPTLWSCGFCVKYG